MKKIIKTIDGKTVNIKIYKCDKTRTVEDKEMDKRVKSAVKAAVDKAKICNYPIARYDKEKQKSYIEYSNGKIEY